HLTMRVDLSPAGRGEVPPRPGNIIPHGRLRNTAKAGVDGRTSACYADTVREAEGGGGRRREAEGSGGKRREAGGSGGKRREAEGSGGKRREAEGSGGKENGYTRQGMSRCSSVRLHTFPATPPPWRENWSGSKVLPFTSANSSSVWRASVAKRRK